MVTQHGHWFSCEECEKKFSKKSDLRGQRKTHEKVLIYNCPQCEIKFSTKAYLKAHIQTSHENSFYCIQCPEKFDSRTLFNHHLKVHLKKPDCSDCKKLLALSAFKFYISELEVESCLLVMTILYLA